MACSCPGRTEKPLIQILAQDPRPSYQKDPQRIYGMAYADLEVRFQVKERRLIVCEVQQNGQD